jgi:hypothetical protein
LQRVAKMLVPATTTQKGDTYDDLAEMYGRMLGQWVLEMNHVAVIVGGFNTQQKNIGQDGVIFEPVSKARQAAAVQFLNDNVFATPAWAIDKEILRRIESIGAISRINNAQIRVMSTLLNSARFARLVEQEALDGASAYGPSELLSGVRKGVWKELDTPNVKIDAYRRNLQHSYLDIANNKINGSSVMPVGLPASFVGLFASTPDEKPLYRAELRTLNASVTAALGKTQDHVTKAHLEGVRDQIAKIIDPKFGPTGGAAAGAIRIFAEQDDPFSFTSQYCWPDYIIKP